MAGAEHLQQGHDTAIPGDRITGLRQPLYVVRRLC